jgi:5-(carboxyamino)imidazole ribonucleotide mutase
MGSDSDLEVMKKAIEILKHFDVEYRVKVVSAHRTPLQMVAFAEEIEQKSGQVVIAGAGGAAHLPGMVASLVSCPVIGVPIKSRISLDGWDSILSILQMPSGIPVATVALNAAANAGLMAVKMLALSDETLSAKMKDYKKSLEAKVDAMNAGLPDKL